MTNKWNWATAHDTKGAGIVVVKKQKDVWKVLGLWKHGGFDIPKGHIEEDEKVFEAALRETYEETKINKLNFQWGKRGVRAHKLSVFLASTTQEPRITFNKEDNKFEHEFAEWLSWEEMKADCYDYLLPIIKWAEQKVTSAT